MEKRQSNNGFMRYHETSAFVNVPSKTEWQRAHWNDISRGLINFELDL